MALIAPCPRAGGRWQGTRPLLQQVAALRGGSATGAQALVCATLLAEVVPLPCATCAGVVRALKLHPTYLVAIACIVPTYPLTAYAVAVSAAAVCFAAACAISVCIASASAVPSSALPPPCLRLRHSLCPPTQLYLPPLSALLLLVSQPLPSLQPVPHSPPPAPPLSLRSRCLRLRCQQLRVHPLR